MSSNKRTDAGVSVTASMHFSTVHSTCAFECVTACLCVTILMCESSCRGGKELGRSFGAGGADIDSSHMGPPSVSASFRSYTPILVTALRPRNVGVFQLFAALQQPSQPRSQQQAHSSMRCRLRVHVQGMSYKSRHIQGCSMVRWPLSPRGPLEKNTRATVMVSAVKGIGRVRACV